MKALKCIFVGLMVLGLVLAGQMAYALPDGIVDNGDGSCTVYPTGSRERTEPRPFLEDVEGLDFKVTEDLVKIQYAVLHYSRVILSARNLDEEITPFNLSVLDYVLRETFDITEHCIIVPQDVIIEGEDLEDNGLTGRTQIIGGEHVFVIAPNVELTYNKDNYEIKLYNPDDPSFVPFFTPLIELPGGEIRPDVTIKHIDSMQASCDFIVGKAARKIVIDDVKVIDMARPWKNPDDDDFPGKYLFAIEMTPGVFGGDPDLEKIKEMVISNCYLDVRATETDPDIQTMPILFSNITLYDNSVAANIQISHNIINMIPGGTSFEGSISGAISFLVSPTALIKIEDIEINIPSFAGPTQAWGLALGGCNNAEVRDVKINGICVFGLLLVTSSEQNYFNNIDMSGLTPIFSYVFLEGPHPEGYYPATKSNTGDKIYVPTCDESMWKLDLGDNNNFSFTVLPPTLAISCLIEKVHDIDELQNIDKSLDAKLSNAQDSLDATSSSYQSAIGKLEAFINECQAQSGKKLTVEQADELIADARKIIDSLNDVY